MAAVPGSEHPNPNAQLTDELEHLASLLHEERVLRFPYFTAATALDLGLAIRAQYISTTSTVLRNPILISISTFTGAVLFQCIAGGDPPDAADLNMWVSAKRNTVRRFGHSSAFIEHRLSATGGRPEEMGLVWPEFAACGGGFPIYLKNAPAAPIGAIVVTGLQRDEDHELIVQTLTSFIPGLASQQRRSSFGPPPVLSPAPHGEPFVPLSARSLYELECGGAQHHRSRVDRSSPVDSHNDFHSDSSPVAGDGDDEADEQGRRWF